MSHIPIVRVYPVWSDDGEPIFVLYVDGKYIIESREYDLEEFIPDGIIDYKFYDLGYCAALRDYCDYQPPKTEVEMISFLKVYKVGGSNEL